MAIKVILAALLVAAVVGPACSVTDKEFNDLKKSVQEMLKVNQVQVSQLTSLARQVSQQQLYVEEMTRSSGDSGIKLTRLDRTGSKPYYDNTFTGRRVAALHTHSDFRGTIGMGELVAVLNGVEFRTRHNDYKLNMPSTTSSEYGANEEIPYPEVPAEVLAKPTLEEQIVEMREWFKAWQNSDTSKRDYRKYFKANLCYLEGMWTEAKGDKAIDEPFSSDRHSIAAKSFFDLQEKIKFTAATGRKDVKENYAYLPTTISDFDEHGNIKYSQWNYNILCHPLSKDVPVSRFRMVDDLANRLAESKTLEEYSPTRMARFSLYEDNKDTLFPKKADQFTNKRTGSFLESLMEEIPGKDNYPADVVDNAFNAAAFSADSNNLADKKPLNAGYYHRRFKVDGRDAMGVSGQLRGFSDSNLYVAYNTRDKITPAQMTRCKKNWACKRKALKLGKCSRENCTTDYVRASYAIPLEIVYSTPLQSWNPFGLKFFDRNQAGQVTGLGTNGTYRRTGGFNETLAYAGVSYRHYYLTPRAFFEKDGGSKKGADKADTAKSGVGVLDSNGKVQQLSPSGVYITLKNIPGVGVLRQRYPIMPIHQEGSAIYKEVNALKDMVFKPHTYQALYPTPRNDNGTAEPVFTYEVAATYQSPPGAHIHTVELTQSDMDLLRDSKVVEVETSSDNGHDHVLELVMQKSGKVVFRTCDGRRRKCWDGHSAVLSCIDCMV